MFVEQGAVVAGRHCTIHERVGSQEHKYLTQLKLQIVLHQSARLIAFSGRLSMQPYACENKSFPRTLWYNLTCISHRTVSGLHAIITCEQYYNYCIIDSNEMQFCDHCVHAYIRLAYTTKVNKPSRMCQSPTEINNLYSTAPTQRLLTTTTPKLQSRDPHTTPSRSGQGGIFSQLIITLQTVRL